MPWEALRNNILTKDDAYFYVSSHCKECFTLFVFLKLNEQIRSHEAEQLKTASAETFITYHFLHWFHEEP